MEFLLPCYDLTFRIQCFFENIVFAPFIFIEDPEDFDDQSTDLTGPLSASTPALPSAGVNTAFRTGNKVDPYYLIMKVCTICLSWDPF